MQARQWVALQEVRSAGCIRAEIDARKIAAPETRVGVQRMRTNLLEPCRLKPRGHMVAHLTTVVALGFERVKERLAAILCRRDLHQTDERDVAPVASHAGGDLHTREKLLHHHRTTP